MISLDEAFDEIPLIAILRGLEPHNAIKTAEVLVSAGFRIIEVPLNSPEPLLSIERIASCFGGQIVVGAGTVLSAHDTRRVADAGGRIVVAPNLSAEVASECARLQVPWCPGIMTPSEAFSAVEQGASALKLFPAEAIPPSAIRAMRAVLPARARLAAVGGITPARMQEYHDAGTDGFGLGSALFTPDLDISVFKRNAIAFVKAARSLHSHC